MSRASRFTAALINSQPMGFYAPAQLTQDARRHGIEVLPVSVLSSEWDCTLEPASMAASAPASQPALRLGLRLVRGLGTAEAERLLSARAESAFTSIDDLGSRARLSARALRLLAAAGACAHLSAHRHEATWRALGVEQLPQLLRGLSAIEPALTLPAPTENQNILSDYRHLGLTTGRHPLALLRPSLTRQGFASGEDLRRLADGDRVRIGGLVTHLQQPSTASGVVFISLEDEFGIINLILWPKVFQAQRCCALEASLLVVEGTLQRQQGVTHVLAQHLRDGSAWLAGLERTSREFR